QPSDGAPTVAVTTTPQGDVDTKYLGNGNTGDDDDDDSEPEPINWGSLIADFTVNEDANMNKTVIATELDAPITFGIDQAASTCDDGAWNPNVYIDASTGVLSGRPTNADVGTCQLALTASGGNGSVAGTVNITVVNTNDAPVFTQQIADFSIGDGRA